jgi:hypothetical protein
MLECSVPLITLQNETPHSLVPNNNNNNNNNNIYYLQLGFHPVAVNNSHVYNL